jgi:uncharacterized protein
MYVRLLYPIIVSKLHKGKAIIILGPRQTGKTTLVKKISADYEGKILILNADELRVRELLTNVSIVGLAQILGNAELVVIDEAQRIENIGITLKLIVDNFPKVQLLVTGSSSLEIMSEINEPMTGRKFEYKMFPISWEEYREKHHFIEAKSDLEHRLIFGMYPDVINNSGEENEILINLTSSYLYKDLLNYKGIRKPELLEQLLKALALQLGNQVSYNELSKLLKVDKETIVSYIDLLEKAFVVFKVNSYSKNIRNELTKSKKIYFYDNGIRNALINNLNPIRNRTDIGALWENFLISERMKFNSYHQLYKNIYFWRNQNQQEIDFIEEGNGAINCYEFKWKEHLNYKFPKVFTEAYHPEVANCINATNFENFVM